MGNGEKPQESPQITLVSRPGVKWPRYRIQLEKGLAWKQAYDQAVGLLRTQERQILTISQFKYEERHRSSRHAREARELLAPDAATLHPERGVPSPRRKEDVF